MILDIRTLVAVNVMLALAVAGMVVIFWRMQRTMPGLGHWAVASALLGIGLLGALCRDRIPDLFSIVVANDLLVASIAGFWNGIRAFDGRPTRWRATAVVIAGTSLVISYNTYVIDDLTARIAIGSTIFSAISFLCMAELIRGPARTVGGTAVTAAALFGFVGLTLLWRAGAATLGPAEQDLFAPTLAQQIHFLVSVISTPLAIVGLLIMSAQRLQRQIEANLAALEIARSRAEQASVAKSRFLATMSHELRTPLNAIIGLSDLHRQEMLGPSGHPKYREYAEDIHSAGTHLLDLITTILDVTKAEAGKLEINPTLVDPRPIVRGAVQLIQKAAEDKDIRLSVELPDGISRSFADPRALKQILLNLLSNAVKFTPRGGKVSIRLQIDKDGVSEIVISDTGIGIASEDIPRIMQPFEQAARGYSRQNGGTGLGLPLVDSLVRLHEGTLTIDSTVGRGTTVTIRLPPHRRPTIVAGWGP